MRWWCWLDLHGQRLDFSLRGRYIPFSGGPRKCVGDQFALMEAVTALAVTLKRYDFSMVPGFEPGLTTGATIHTKNGLFMHVRNRGAAAGQQQAVAASVASN